MVCDVDGGSILEDATTVLCAAAIGTVGVAGDIGVITLSAGGAGGAGGLGRRITLRGFTLNRVAVD